MNEISPTKLVKAGSSAEATAERRRLFVEAYLSNGHNGAEAAKAAGYASKHAKREAVRLLALPTVRQLVNARARQITELAEMGTEAWARELRAIAFSKIGDLLGPDGTPLPIALLPPHVQAAIASVKIGPLGVVEYKLWNKTQALETIARHLGLFERDNSQLRPDVRVEVVLVG